MVTTATRAGAGRGAACCWAAGGPRTPSGCTTGLTPPRTSSPCSPTHSTSHSSTRPSKHLTCYPLQSPHHYKPSRQSCAICAYHDLVIVTGGQGEAEAAQVIMCVYNTVHCTFTGCPVKLFPLGYLLFCCLLLMQIAKVGTFLKNSGNLLHDRHKNFEN